jgi:uncharacterized protein (DUF2267 family)
MTNESPREVTGPQMSDDAALDFFDAVEECPELPTPISGAEAVAYVLGGMLRLVRLTAAREIVRALPRLVRPLLEPSIEGRDEAPEQLLVRQVVEYVAECLGTPMESAETICRCVTRSAARHLPVSATDALQRQLPEDVRGLWDGHAPEIELH